MSIENKVIIFSLDGVDKIFKCIVGPGWLNELGSWITYQLIQACYQYGVGSRPAL